MSEPARTEWDKHPWDWKEELEKRLVLVQPGECIRGLFPKGLLEVVRALGDEEMVRRCVAACGEEKFVDFFNYPFSADLRLVYTAVGLLGPRFGGDLDEVMRQLGRRATADFLGSPAGSALKLLTLRDPKRLLSTFPTIYKVALNFGERSIEWTGPRSGRLLMKREFLPTCFHEGALGAFLEALCIQGQVRGHQLALLDSQYDISWP